MTTSTRYEAWLSPYTSKLAQMDSFERAKIAEDDQVYVDYLDYVDEWEWHTQVK